MDKESGTVVKVPILDGTNYDSWKPRMEAYIKSLGNQAWKNIVKGWDPPKIEGADGKPTSVIKPEEDWDEADELASQGNFKALNAIFNGVDKNAFKLIKNCKHAKIAWKTLKKVHEGNSKVKMAKLQLLSSSFENLRMKDDESIQDFYMTVLDIANESEDLGEKISDDKLVRKMLRSLPKRFDIKVMAIEEACDISTMTVDELISSLKTYESAINERSEKKKSIAFSSSIDSSDNKGELNLE